MTRANLCRWTAALTAAAAAVLAGWGCGEKQEAPKRITYEPPPVFARNLNATEIDTLISLKREYQITRDEYWDGHGGVLANPSFEVWYPNGRMYILQGAAVLKQMEIARRDMEKRFGRAPTTRLTVVCSGSLEVFRAATGRDWWHYSLIKGDTINLQAPMDLYARRLFTVAVPREYYEWAIGNLSGHRAPRWLEEGLASQLAHEVAVLANQTSEFAEQGVVMTTGDMDRELRRENDRIPARRAYYNAQRMVEKLLQTRGEAAVFAFVLACGEEKDLDAASQRAFGADYDAIVEEAHSWTLVEGQ